MKFKYIIYFLVICFFRFCILEEIGHRDKKDVILYNGPGVSKESLEQTELALAKFLPEHTILKLNPAEVINDSWEKRAVLFVMPGGADIPYTKALNGAGNDKIRKFVENGGRYLGICAGGYYAGGFVDFAKDTSLEVQGERELAFFPGVVEGPILAPYDYLSPSGSRAAGISWVGDSEFEKGEEFVVYYNGGGYFVDPGRYDRVKVLASYDQSGELAAIIQCSVGKGLAILSGVHFEYDPALIKTKDSHLKKVLLAISQENEHREALLKTIFKLLQDQLEHQI